jgi:hypothetical protein
MWMKARLGWQYVELYSKDLVVRMTNSAGSWSAY